MADLDDFFAKKDRKKSKGKKFTTTDEIAKKLEETGKKEKLEKAKKDKTTMQSGPIGETDEQGNALKEEDEWREFEEQKKDYSGLRIGKLQIQEGGGGEGDGGEEDEEQVLEENEAGEMVLRSRKIGPWKMQQQAQQAQAQPPPPPVEQPPPQPQAPEMTDSSEKRAEVPERQSYRPPAMRGPQRELNAMIGGPRMSRIKTAPDISNEQSFPTLSAAKTHDPNSPWGRNRGRRDEGAAFEEVRNSKSHSSRYDASRLASGPPKLALGNKFGALQDQS